MLSCQCQLPTKLAVAKTPVLIGSANCLQNWQLLKRQLLLAVETANRNWRQFWSQPRQRNFFFYHGFADLLRHIRCPNLVIHTLRSLFARSAIFTG